MITAEEAQVKTDITLSVRNVSKMFYGITVLSDFFLDIHRGEIVALIGQNGSGKSTFIKILSGFHAPEPGASFHMGDKDISGLVGQTAEHTGMAFIHQDLPLIASMTILENLRIARFTTGFAGRILWRNEEVEVARILATVGLFVSPQLRVDQLSVTEQALVAIARGLSEVQSEDPLSPRLLVLDEPTAYLPLDGVKRLFDVIKELASQGISILFVSHRLDEVLDHCTRAVVLRGGELVADVPTAGLTERGLVESMLGSPPGEIYPDRDIPLGERVLQVTGLSGSNVIDAEFAGRRGEIVGFVGLPGEGYDQIPHLLAGAQPCTGGTAIIEETTIDLRTLDPAKAIRHGIVLLPADRKGASGAAQLAVGDNLTLPTLSRYTSLRSVLRHRRERSVIRTELERFTVTPADGAAPLETLSGGNQQKVLIAKWAIADHKVFLLHEPTQGVDVGAKRQVFAHLNQLARRGALLIISSVEYDDLVNICNRVHVVRQGKIVRTFSGDELNAHDLASAVHQR